MLPAKFSNNGTSIGTSTLSSGVATLNITSLPVGTNSLTASYAGDANFTTASSSAISVVVASAVPSVTLSPASLTFASQDTGTISTAQTVTLTNSGQAALNITSISASGDFAETNTCGTSVAAGANCIISVTFSPTTAGTRTGTLSIINNAAGSPQTVALTGTGSNVGISTTSTGLTIASAGGSATASIQISAGGDFSGTVNLTCAVKYQGTGTPTDAPTCSLNPAQEQVSSGLPVSATLTVTTTAAGSSARLDNWLFHSGAALAAVLFCGFVPRRRWRGMALLALLCVIGVCAIVGCGGGSSTGGGGATPPLNPGTTTGSYGVTVTATSGTISASTTIPLSVQ